MARRRGARRLDRGRRSRERPCAAVPSGLRANVRDGALRPSLAVSRRCGREGEAGRRVGAREGQHGRRPRRRWRGRRGVRHARSSARFADGPVLPQIPGWAGRFGLPVPPRAAPERRSARFRLLHLGRRLRRDQQPRRRPRLRGAGHDGRRPHARRQGGRHGPEDRSGRAQGQGRRQVPLRRLRRPRRRASATGWSPSATRSGSAAP